MNKLGELISGMLVSSQLFTFECYRTGEFDLIYRLQFPEGV